MEPKISVVIAAYYSYNTLEGCLKALSSQTIKPFEIIVVNSSQEDETANVVKKFPTVTFYQSSSRLLPQAAFSKGASMAKGSSIAFLAPDCIAKNDWLEKLFQKQLQGYSVVVGSLGLGSKVWYEQGVHICKFSSYLSHLPAGQASIAIPSNSLFSREVWESYGPFDGDYFSSDTVFSWKLIENGVQPQFEPSAIVEHIYLCNAKDFWKERLFRAEEFALVRAAYFHWSKKKALAYFFATPLIFAFFLSRSWSHVRGSVWMWVYFTTLPVHLAGHLSWSIGEAKGYWKYLFR
ncbi:MAG: glycosyltransferase family 2 protein [Blastocatellia bacterium]|nr:glycosyltransferase family 2 protein [Blastocatellia bacterium]